MELGVHRENTNERVTQPTWGYAALTSFCLKKCETVKVEVLYLNVHDFWRNTGIFHLKSSAAS